MSTARPALIVEDDDASREALVDHLAANGEWQPVGAASLGEAFFRRAENRIVLRQTLLDVVRGYSSGVITHMPATHIYQVRRKTKADPAACQLLATQPGGYQLNAAGGLVQ